MKKRTVLTLIVFSILISSCSDKLNVKECTNLESDEKDNCLFVKIPEAVNLEQYSNGKICSLFDSNEYKSRCYMNFGVNWKKEELCNKASEDHENFCIALVNLDSDYCWKISAPVMKQDCLGKLEAEQQKNFDYQNNKAFEEYKTELGKLQLYKGPIMNGKDTFYYMVDYEARGKHFHEYIDQLTLNAIYWLINNTEKDDKILAWWDYGHAIEGVAAREVVFYAPSEAVYKEIYEKQGEISSYFSSHDDYSDEKELKDFAASLISSDEEQLWNYMKERNLNYLMITAFERDKAYEIATAADVKLDEYFYEDKKPEKDFGDNALIFKMIGENSLELFEIRYEDSFVRIYALKS